MSNLRFKSVEVAASRKACKVEVLHFLEKIRLHIDNLELFVDNEIWPLRNIANFCSSDYSPHRQHIIY